MILQPQQDYLLEETRQTDIASPMRPISINGFTLRYVSRLAWDGKYTFKEHTPEPFGFEQQGTRLIR